MFSTLHKITLDDTWQPLSDFGLKEFFIALEIESDLDNVNPVLVRREPGGEFRTLNPGDIDRLKAEDRVSQESYKDTGIAVQGTAGEIVKFEQTLYDYQQEE